MRAYCSPSRFAVCCVLLRQIVPRHSPYALSSLTTCELYLSIYFFFFLESVWCSTLKSLFRLSEKISLFFFLQTFLSIVSLYSVFNVLLSYQRQLTQSITYFCLCQLLFSFFTSFFHQLRFFYSIFRLLAYITLLFLFLQAFYSLF